MTRIAATAALLLVLAACHGEKSSPPAAVTPPKVEGQKVVFAADSPQLKNLVSEPVAAERSERVRLTGRLAWDETVTSRVGAPVAGKVVKLLVEPGARVKAGDVLAVIASPEVGQAQSEALRAGADLAVAEKNVKRQTELHGAGVISDKDLQQAEADYQRARAERERAVARARTYGGADAVNQQMVLRAPIGGIVVERNANPGQEVRPELAPPAGPELFVVSDPARLWVQLDVPESGVAGVRAGQPFEFKVIAMPGQAFRGKLQYVGDALDPATRMVKARGVVDNAERKLKAEMFVAADVDIERAAFQRVPAAAVLLLGEVRYVFVDLGNGAFERRPVRAEEGHFGVVEVAEGLAPGDKVVTQGPLLLQQILAGASK